MDKESQKNAIDSLREWSRWLIGIDFAAATGCVVVLQDGMMGPPRPFLILAISAFAISVLCSVFLVRVLATVVEKLPLLDSNSNPTSIYDFVVYRGITVKYIARAQMLLLTMGGIFFLMWVFLKPAG